MKKDIIIIGASDTADRIISFIEHYDLFNVRGCAVNKAYINSERSEVMLAGKKRQVFALEDIDNVRDSDTVFFVALLWNRLNADRRDLFNKAKSLNLPLANIISPKASVRGEIGFGCYIGDYVVLQERSSIEDNVWLMDGTIIGHRATVKTHVFCSLRALVGGSSFIGEQTYLGLNCTIFDEVSIGEKCLIGGSTVVKRNLPPCTIVKTANDSNIIKQYPDSIIESKWLVHHNIR